MKNGGKWRRYEEWRKGEKEGGKESRKEEGR